MPGQRERLLGQVGRHALAPLLLAHLRAQVLDGPIELGAHPFLTLTLFIRMYERFDDEPLGFQRQYAHTLAHFELPYPDIAT